MRHDSDVSPPSIVETGKLGTNIVMDKMQLCFFSHRNVTFKFRNLTYSAGTQWWKSANVNKQWFLLCRCCCDSGQLWVLSWWPPAGRPAWLVIVTTPTDVSRTASTDGTLSTVSTVSTVTANRTNADMDLLWVNGHWHYLHTHSWAQRAVPRPPGRSADAADEWGKDVRDHCIDSVLITRRQSSIIYRECCLEL